MITIEIKGKGLENLIKKWQEAELAIEKNLPKLDPYIEESIVLNYAAEGRPKWQKWSEGYLHHVLTEYGRRWPILYKSGDKSRIERASARGAWVKSGLGKWRKNLITIWYGIYHQYGLGLPIRKSLRFPKPDRDRMKAEIESWVLGQFRR